MGINKTIKFQTTIDMLMSKEEQSRIGINPDDVDHKRPLEQVLCRILEELDRLIIEKERLKRVLYYELPEKYPDNCEICKGNNLGVKGNENIIDDKIVCNYCYANILEKEQSLKSKQ